MSFLWEVQDFVNLAAKISDLIHKKKYIFSYTLQQHSLNGNFHQVQSPGAGASVHHFEAGYIPEISDISCSFFL